MLRVPKLTDLLMEEQLQAGDGGQTLLIKLQSKEEEWTETRGAGDGGVADLSMCGTVKLGESVSN